MPGRARRRASPRAARPSRAGDAGARSPRLAVGVARGSRERPTASPTRAAPGTSARARPAARRAPKPAARSASCSARTRASCAPQRRHAATRGSIVTRSLPPLPLAHPNLAAPKSTSFTRSAAPRADAARRRRAASPRARLGRRAARAPRAPRSRVSTTGSRSRRARAHEPSSSPSSRRARRGRGTGSRPAPGSASRRHARVARPGARGTPSISPRPISRRMAHAVEEDEAPDPVDVGLLGPRAVVPDAQRLAHPIEQPRRRPPAGARESSFTPFAHAVQAQPAPRTAG